MADRAREKLNLGRKQKRKMNDAFLLESAETGSEDDIRHLFQTNWRSSFSLLFERGNVGAWEAFRKGSNGPISNSHHRPKPQPYVPISRNVRHALRKGMPLLSTIEDSVLSWLLEETVDDLVLPYTDSYGRLLSHVTAEFHSLTSSTQEDSEGKRRVHIKRNLQQCAVAVPGSVRLTSVLRGNATL
eukprot:CAMPEP_0184644042 /NCGR_PEP_ID=MMETSP0308-20130426/825_1 /TAXON_ID=38269 /ORGANISM="Gloeochaete witrockiana, Strain SAG 46.84" /LENGTH=185 /DNA_ID=CAMNT_0027072351 /DNA_START=108 /DNA_END=665 /DNA_ORIENTATION=-